MPLASAEDQPPEPGEVIYRDEIGAICRRWNWREADRTKLTASTKNAFLCIEALPPVPSAQLESAALDLSEMIQEHLGGEATMHILTPAQSQVTFDLPR